MSLRITPPLAHPTHILSTHGAPSAPGVHDTLRSNLSLAPPPPKANPSALNLSSAHPLEARLSQWRGQQDRLKMEMLRRQFGIAEPVRRGMELAIVRAGEWRPMCLSTSSGFGYGGVHEDILSGRDMEVGWEDVFVGGEFETGEFHAEMEGRFGMGW